jgi:HD-like signal output (HDOD) protein
MFVGLLQPLGCIWPLSDLQSQQIVKYLRNEWNVPKDFEQAVINQQNNMPYDFIDTPRHKLEVDFHEFRKHLHNEIN